MRAWRYINILSLDVAAGAMTGCAFFAQIFGISLLPHALISLGLIVWIIYTVDHLIDARRATGQPSTERHRFHKRHGKTLMAAVAIAVVVVVFEAFYVRKPVLFAGVGFAILVVGYMVLQTSLKSTKEVIGALLYTAGVLVGPWSLLDRVISVAELLLISLYFVTAMINLMLFSLIDRDYDLLDKRESFATIFGARATQTVIVIGFTIVAGLCIVLEISFSDYTGAMTTILTMNVLLLITFRYRDYFRVDDRYRRIGDLAFLIPGIYLLHEYALEWI
jgi:hypothetical protein